MSAELFPADAPRPKPPVVATRSGRLLSLAEPSADSIDPHDVATQLSRKARFSGATRWPYTVAEHCFRASHCTYQGKPLTRDAALVALLHDAHEAYVGDLVTPAKSLVPRFEELEHRLARAVYDRFGLGEIAWDVSVAVRAVDNALLVCEAADLGVPGIRPPQPADRRICPWRRIVPMHPEAARDLWLERLAELTGEAAKGEA